MKDYLFVYGTLRKDYDLKLKNRVANDLEYIGKARIGASLYDLGRYPGAVRNKRTRSQKPATEIIGDVFLVNNPERVLRVLDKYEGYAENKMADSEFVRKRNRVKLNSGQHVNAWIYWYNFDPGDKVRIKHKDYLNYLKNKSIT